MSASNLHPCPFCDEDEKIELVCGGGRCPKCGEPLGAWYVRCNTCGAATGLYSSLDEAVDAWNAATPRQKEGGANG